MPNQREPIANKRHQLKIMQIQTSIEFVRNSKDRWTRDNFEEANVFVYLAPVSKKSTPDKVRVIYQLLQSSFKRDLPIKKFKVKEVHAIISTSTPIIHRAILSQKIFSEEQIRRINMIFDATSNIQVIPVTKQAKDSTEVCKGSSASY